MRRNRQKPCVFTRYQTVVLFWVSNRNMARLGALIPPVPLVRLGLLLALVSGVRGFANGMVTPACGDMVPGHGASSQTGPSPYNVTSNSTTYRDGDTITGKSRRVIVTLYVHVKVLFTSRCCFVVSVQLQSTGATPFKGFLLQAREVGGESPLGSFRVAGGATQTLSCLGSPVSSFGLTAL